MTALSVELCVAFGQNRLFDDFHLDLPDGEITCLLGKSGSGKSTLLRFIAGLLTPDVAYGKVSTSDDLPVAGRVAWMAQQDLLLPWRTVIENVTLGAQLRGELMQNKRDKALQLLAEVDLEGVENLYPHQLSGGMRQRAALARNSY